MDRQNIKNLSKKAHLKTKIKEKACFYVLLATIKMDYFCIIKQGKQELSLQNIILT